MLTGISYWASYGIEDNKPLTRGTLNEVLGSFQILYGELSTKFGAEKGCWRGSSILRNYDKKEPTKEECFDFSNLTTSTFRAEAKKSFEQCDIAKGGYKDYFDLDIYTYRIYWSTQTTNYTLRVGLTRNYKKLNVENGEAFCILSVSPIN